MNKNLSILNNAMLYAICMRRGGVNQSYFLLGWGGGGGGGGGGHPGELGGLSFMFYVISVKFFISSNKFYVLC